MAVAAVCCSAAVQAQTPTPAQVEAFKNLPPAMQQQVLQQLGGKAGAQRPAAPSAQKAPDATAVPELQLPEVEVVPRFRAGDSLILAIEPKPPATPAAAEIAANSGLTQALANYRERLLKGNPYRLDATGVLALPQAPAIALAGLTDEQATQRLNTEPALNDYLFTVTLLPVEPALKPYGYDLFTRGANGLAPAQDGPVPADYVLGPGDTLDVQLVGEKGGTYPLQVARDGTIDFPELGPITVAGMRFPEAAAQIESRVQRQMIGLKAHVSMGTLRSISVFVLGEAKNPGSYTVSGLSTITHALYAAGGVAEIGSLRNVQLKRSGVVVRRLDLYDLLLNGDNRDDARLLPGDVIFIPPVGVTAAIAGEVRRPAIYELREGAKAADLIYLAGGLSPVADPRTASVERVDERRNRTVVSLDLSRPQDRAARVQTGDVLRILPIRDAVENAVRLEGHVHRVGSTQWRQGMRLSDLVGSDAELQPGADLHYVLVRREEAGTRRVSVRSADLAAALAARGSEADLVLEPRDVVTVFDLATPRERVVGPLLDELARQSSAGGATQMVGIGGAVKAPGRYPLESGMTLRSLIRAGGGFDESAYLGEAELTRYEVINGEKRETALIKLDLRQVMAGQGDDALLMPYDYLVIKRVPQWGDQETITLQGEVRFPGTYPIQRGETLRSVINRAGGLTDLAFPEGAVFTRKDLAEREQKQLELLAQRLQREIAGLTLEQSQSAGIAAGAAETSSAGQQLLTELRNTKPVGRLVLDVKRLSAGNVGGPADVVLRNGDRLAIPRLTQEVTVLGEVQNATSHLYAAGLSREDYLDRSGGLAPRADKKRIYVVRADGSVAASSRSLFFSRNTADIRPGDTIVVPLDAERMKPLQLWQAVTQIVYNLAIAAAAVNSF